MSLNVMHNQENMVKTIRKYSKLFILDFHIMLRAIFKCISLIISEIPWKSEKLVTEPSMVYIKWPFLLII